MEKGQKEKVKKGESLMTRKDGKDRPGWWVQVYVGGRAQTYRCDNKTQAKALYGRLKAEIREKKFFSEQFAVSKDITLRERGFVGTWKVV